MWLDLVSLFFVIFFAAAGYFRGFLAVAVTFLALGAAYFFTPGAAGWIGESAGWSGLDPDSRYWVLLGAAALLLYLGVNFAGLFLLHLLTRNASEEDAQDEARTFRHRLLGLVLSALQGLLVGVLLSFLLGAVPEAMRERSPWLGRQMESSRLVAITKGFNPILKRRADLDLLAQLREAARVLGLARELEVIEDAQLPERARRLLEDSRLKKFFEDSRLIEALREADYGEILSGERWRELLGDADLREALKGVDLGAIRGEIEQALARRRERVEEAAPL